LCLAAGSVYSWILKPCLELNQMKVLIAEDDQVSQRILSRALENFGYEVMVADNGVQALNELQNHDSPALAILDWMMPGMDGVEVCRLVRATDKSPPPYIILLTAKETKESIVQGLQSGANDYVVKPFDFNELRARVQVGERMVNLQEELASRVRDLEAALAHVKRLRGLLPICAYCKKIRDDRNYWHDLEAYVRDHSDVDFSHGVCPECFQRTLQELKGLTIDTASKRSKTSGH